MTEHAPLLIDAREAARLLSVHPNTLRKMATAGTLGPRPLHLGRALRWRADELRAWVQAGCPPRCRWEWPPQGGAR